MRRRHDAVLAVASLLVGLVFARPIASAQASPAAPQSDTGTEAGTETEIPVPLAGGVRGGPAAAAPVTGTEAPASTGTQAETTESEAAESSTPAGRVRVAVVLVGDPNVDARAAAEQIERAIEAELDLPADPALRASLLGGTGEDTIAPVVRDRRALGGTEAEDVPLLTALGDRADAALLLVVRRRSGHREVVGFDVQHGAFFEGALALDGTPDAARVLRFARARARATAEAPSARESGELAASAERTVAESVPSAAGAPAAETPAGEPQHEPEWIELNWPYLLAGALLAGAAAFVIVYTAEDGSQPVPTLRFRPGGTP